MHDLEKRCRQVLSRTGRDGRTSYLAEAFYDDEPARWLEKRTGLPSAAVDRLLRGLVSDRYVRYAERRAQEFGPDASHAQVLLSQGYRRGLRWRGVPLGKTCWDVGIYQQLLQDLRPATIIECGTGLGASALFFADHCRMFGLETRVITIDTNRDDVHRSVLTDPAIEFIAGNVRDLANSLPAERLNQLPHPWLVVEDSHAHVPLIVDHLQAHMHAGDYLVIEDIGLRADGSEIIEEALRAAPAGTFMVDTDYTDLFGRNVTCAPDAIFRRM